MDMGIKINNEVILIIFCLLVIPVCSMIMPWSGCLIMILASIYFSLKNSYKTLLFFVCVAFIQNITLAVAANRFSGTSTTLYSISKEAMLYMCVAFALFNKKKWHKFLILFVMFLFLLISVFLYSNTALYARIIGVRQILLPFICFLFGAMLKITDKKIKKISTFIIYAGFVAGIIGILELFIIGDAFWNSIPLLKYEVNKGTTFYFTRGLPTNFYTYDLMPITGSISRRLVSIFVDPLLTGHYLFLGFILADIYFKGNKKRIYKFLLFLFSMFTLSKGVIIGYILYFIFKILRYLSYDKIKKCLLAAGFSGIGIIFCLYKFIMAYLPSSSTATHLGGFIKGLTNSSFFGNGLGTAGTITGILTDKSKMLTAESFIGTLTVQTGYLGLFIFLCFWIYVFFKILKSGKILKNSFCYNSAILLLAVITESLFSESSISIVGTGMYFVFAGLSMKKVYKEENGLLGMDCNKIVAEN